MRPGYEEHPIGGGPERDPEDGSFAAGRPGGEDEARRLRRARGALERLAGELQDTDEVLDVTLEELRPPADGDARD